jgi:hypothetical protein
MHSICLKGPVEKRLQIEQGIDFSWENEARTWSVKKLPLIATKGHSVIDKMWSENRPSGYSITYKDSLSLIAFTDLLVENEYSGKFE